MKKISFCFILFWGFVQIAAQKDSISINVQFSEDKKVLNISQRLVYFNNSENDLKAIKLLNWVSAYNKRGTSLVYRKLEDRNSDLHFAKPEQLGKLLQLEVKNIQDSASVSNLSDENIYIPLSEPLRPGESTQLELQYQIQLPDQKFTGYGISEKNIALKYFFLVPDHFDPDNTFKKVYYDIEESVSFNTYWNVNFDLPPDYFIESGLPKTEAHSFRGYLNSDPEFLISTQEYPSITINTKDIQTQVSFGYNLSPQDKENLEFYLPLHLSFVKDKIGSIPQKLFISNKFRDKEDFFGNNDINFWKFRFQLFSAAEKIDMDYFGIIAKKVLDESIITDKQDNHWFKNGLKSYLEIQYLKKFYPDTKLLGSLPETRIFGIKPLKLFHASRVNLLDRYGLAYQYIMAQNLDQKINSEYTVLSNFNEMAISSFETGSLFNYSADKMGTEKFETVAKNYIAKNNDKQVQPHDFLKELAEKEKSADYLSSFFQQKNRVNFKLKNFKRGEDSLHVKIYKNTPLDIPVKLEAQTRDGSTKSYWVETPENEHIKTVAIPALDIYKITLNDDFIFPESKYRDNFLYTKGIFSNTKKIKLKFLKDIPNPEYNEIYISPRIRFNNTYDKFLFGINLKNQSLFEQKFLYSLTPMYSSGTGKLTGSGAVSYSILPAESIIRSLTFGVSGSYFHYDYDLAYRKASVFSNINFRKNPRSTVSRGISLSYNYFERDLSPLMAANSDYSRYNLWSAGYGYSDNQMIHEKSFSISAQGMKDFNKITAEGFYRWEFAPKQKLSLRLFAGYFINNDTRNSTFNYGISRVSNYSFSYSLLGESATGGILSQQFILADGGFKSFIPGSVNQWITSFNVDSSVWKIFHVYADAGIYKNKHASTEFIWDSGIKVRLIPDFLEIYFPIQSSLGFEPSFKDYAKRIRYTLVLNLGAIINAARRGWY
ncbi:gluzincin family metallopeptidase [Chryseobacterium sp. CT-SW4]|uniref:aminopeptidase n=1 Tax=Chryseobacterium sp. SW-1 TaxID=3157343 RepID=UPI003B0169C8